MSQKTNLNVSPYYDDFDKADNFYRVLFKPGYPVQARELTGLQSILQNQVESFGSHMFKEGSMVIPGGVTADDQFTTVKVNPDHLGIDITVYLDAIVALNNGRGAKVKGESSEVVGTIKGYLLPPSEGVEEITLFVKYRDGAGDGETVEFADGEVLILQENVSYGNTTLNIGDTVLTTLSVNSTSTGFAVGAAYEVPQIMLRASIQYNTEIKHSNAKLTETLAGTATATEPTDLIAPSSMIIKLRSALSTRIRSTRISYGDGGSSNNSEVTATFHLYDATTDTETNSGAARDNNDQLRIKIAGTSIASGIQCFVKILSNAQYLQ